jgi:hypothetical protein
MHSTVAVAASVAAQRQDLRLFRDHFLTATSTNLNLEI